MGGMTKLSVNVSSNLDRWQSDRAAKLAERELDARRSN